MSTDNRLLPDPLDLRRPGEDPHAWRFSMKMQKAWKSMAGARSLMQPVDSALSPPMHPRQSSHRKRQVWHSLYASSNAVQKSRCGNTWRTFSNGTFEDLAWSQQMDAYLASDGKAESSQVMTNSARSVSSG